MRNVLILYSRLVGPVIYPLHRHTDFPPWEIRTFSLRRGRPLCRDVFICGKEAAFQTRQVDQCHLGTKVGVTQLITDVFADALLVISPWYLITRVKVTRAQKLRPIFVFSSSSITTIVSINHAIWLLVRGGRPENLAAVIETGVSLIVANISVLVSASFRLRGPSAAAAFPSANASARVRGIPTFLRTTNFCSDERETNPSHVLVTINVAAETEITNDGPPHPADRKYIELFMREGEERDETKCWASSITRTSARNIMIMNRTLELCD